MKCRNERNKCLGLDNDRDRNDNGVWRHLWRNARRKRV